MTADGREDEPYSDHTVHAERILLGAKSLAAIAQTYLVVERGDTSAAEREALIRADKHLQRALSELS